MLPSAISLGAKIGWTFVANIHLAFVDIFGSNLAFVDIFGSHNVSLERSDHMNS